MVERGGEERRGEKEWGQNKILKRAQGLESTDGGGTHMSSQVTLVGKRRPLMYTPLAVEAGPKGMA